MLVFKPTMDPGSEEIVTETDKPVGYLFRHGRSWKIQLDQDFLDSNFGTVPLAIVGEIIEHAKTQGYVPPV